MRAEQKVGTIIRSLIRRIENRQISAIARAVSILENGYSHRSANQTLKAKILKYLNVSDFRKSHGFLVGVTGPAGSGKSTLIAALAKLVRREKKKVAVIAVDPTSPRTGGAFLGDRVRMQELADDPGVFIRSMASRGAQGGIARATKDAAKLFIKAGYDFVLIETVGAGQLDYEVTKFADLTLLVLTPESGDEIQFMKAGLREVVDVFVINKADRPGANALEDFLRRAQGNAKAKVPIFKTIAEEKKWIEPLYQFILESKLSKNNAE